MQHGTQGHMAAPRGPTRGGGVDAWQGQADAWVGPRGMRSDWLASDGPTGIVGPS